MTATSPIARRARNTAVFAALAAAAMAAVPASAAILNWDADGALPVNGGAGAWTTSDPKLWEDGAGNYVNWNSATPDAAVFGGTAGTVTVGENIVAASLTFNTNNYILDLTGGDLQVGAVTAPASPTNLVLGSASQINTVTITNSLAGPANTKTFTMNGNFTSNSGPKLSGNLNVVFNGGAWTPAIDHDFTGRLDLFGTGQVRSDNNSQGLGSAVGDVRLGNTASLLLNTASGQFRTFTRNLEFIGTGSSIGVSGVKAVTISGNLSGTGNLKMFGSQGMLILSGNNSGFTGLYTGTSAGWMVVAQSDNAFGVEGDPLKNIAISSASGIGFLGDADGSVNVGAKNVNITGGAHSDGIGNVHNFGGTNSYAGAISVGNIINFGAENDSELTLKGVISGTRPFQKVGGGTIVLANNNTIGNASATPVDIRNGTLRLDFNLAPVSVDIINSGNASNSNAAHLVLSGGTLEIKGKAGATITQRFKNSTAASFTVNSGESAVRLNEFGAASISVDFGQMQARAVGGTVDFTLPSTGTYTLATSTISPAGTTGEIILANNAAFATVNGNTWAARSGTAIVAGAGAFYTANDATTLAGNADMSGGVDTTVATAAVTSLRFNNAGARTITAADLTTGGILVTSAVGNNTTTITGGTLKGAADKDLVVIQNNTGGKVAIDSQIVNSGTSSGLTKAGAGTVELTNAANSYTGATVITGGVLKLTSATALPGGLGTTSNTSLLILDGGVLGLTSDFNRTLSTAGTVGVQFVGNGGFAAYGADRIVNMGGAGASSSWNSTSAGSANFLRTGHELLLSANDATHMIDYQNGISFSGAAVPLQRTIRVFNGAADVDAKISGVLSGEDGFNKEGLGTLEISNAANTYIGRTNINAGRLKVTGILTGSTPITINTSGTLLLAGAGKVTGPTTVNSGGLLTGSSTPLTGTSVQGVTLNTGGTISPGASIGILATGSNTWTGADNFILEASTDGTGAAGTEWDKQAITGSLNLTSAAGITVKLISMADGSTPGALASWDPGIDHTWSGFITTTTGITAFDPASFSVDSSAFQNTVDGVFSVVQTGNNLDLVYTAGTAVPEPASLAVLGLGAVALLTRRRKD